MAFAGSDELDRRACDLLDGKGRSTTGVAVELGHDDAVHRHPLVEDPGRLDGILSRHGIDDEIDLMWIQGESDTVQFLHEVVIDMQSTGGVEYQDIEPFTASSLQRPLADADGDTGGITVLGAFVGFSMEGDLGISLRVGLDSLHDQLQLFNGGRALQVGGADQRVAAVSLQIRCQLAAGGGLSCALESTEHDDGRRGVDEHDMTVDWAHQIDQMLVDDVGHLLTGFQALEDFRSKRLLLDSLAEVVDDIEIDIGLQKCLSDFLHGLAYVRLAESATAREIAEGLAEAVTESVEHGFSSVAGSGLPLRFQPCMQSFGGPGVDALSGPQSTSSSRQDPVWE